MDADDDDRVLGMTVQNPDNSLHNTSNAVSAAVANDGEGGERKGGEEDEEFLDLGPPTDDDGSDAMAGESSHGADNGSNVSNEDDVGSENNAPLSDEALVQIESKSEAKALGRKLYKRWKKLHKRSKKERRRHGSKKKSKRDDKKHKEKKKEKKRKRRRTDDDDEDNDFENDMGEEEEKKEKEGKRKGSNSKRQRKSSRHEKPIALGDEDLGSAPFANIDEVLLAEEAAARRSGGRSGKGSRSSNNNSNNNLFSEVKPKKLSADAQRGALRAMAAAVVNSMREARLQDEVDMNQRRPPLHRVSILDKVVAQCRREALRPFLIEEGILQELSTWLYDFNRREIAAFELRSAALDILLGFPIDGELNAGIARNGDEILDAFTGMTREHLINTDLGSAVNALRQDKHEVHQNRSKAVRLLERLSRAMSGGVKSARRSGDGSGNSSFAGGSGGSSSNVTWKCQDDPTVAPPFHMVQTGTEAFQTALVRPDPLDPLSYLRVPPRRAPKAYVTNLGGNVGVGE
ncbi:Transcription factor IIS [Trypanosoma melophagium]|uniref:Transcription factor IIS n=1 Tax=Trypanosoma melophagium TaxID=715481 RepID=UPI00351A2398|nr:Transcription factor IIS [Trypanosoma melophagium]